MNVGEYLDYENCKCGKRLIDKLTGECAENIDEVKIAGMTLFECENECKSLFAIYVILQFMLCHVILQSALELVLILFITST